MPRKAQSTPEQEEKKEAVNAPADEKQEQEKGTEAPTEGAVSPEVTPEQEEKKEDTLTALPYALSSCICASGAFPIIRTYPGFNSIDHP